MNSLTVQHANSATLKYYSQQNGALAVENLFLRKQSAKYQERKLKPRRPDAAFRIGLVLSSRPFDSKHALVVVQPQTLVRWHCRGLRLFWRWK